MWGVTNVNVGIFDQFTIDSTNYIIDVSGTDVSGTFVSIEKTVNNLYAYYLKWHIISTFWFRRVKNGYKN